MKHKPEPNKMPIHSVSQSARELILKCAMPRDPMAMLHVYVYVYMDPMSMPRDPFSSHLGVFLHLLKMSAGEGLGEASGQL